MTTIAKGPQAEWDRWCKQYRTAFLSVLGTSGFTPARDTNGDAYDEENTTRVVRQAVWNHSDGLVAVCLHGLKAVTSMAATIAHSGAPPCVGPSTAGSKQRFVVLHDGAFTFKSNQGHQDGGFSAHLTGPIEDPEVRRIIHNDVPVLERLNDQYGSVSVCGPISLSIGCLPTTPVKYFEDFKNAFRAIWNSFRKANFLSISYDAMIEGIPYVKGYYPLPESKTIGTFCSKICGIFTMAQLGAVPPVAHSCMLENINASDHGHDKARLLTFLSTMIPVFAPPVVARPREKESPIRGKESPIKAKEKETREEGDRTVADHGQREVSALEALRPPVTGSRPLKSAAMRGVIMRWIRLILLDPLDETILSVALPRDAASSDAVAKEVSDLVRRNGRCEPLSKPCHASDSRQGPQVATRRCNLSLLAASSSQALTRIREAEPQGLANTGWDCRIPASVQKPLLSATAVTAALALEPRGSANILRGSAILRPKRSAFTTKPGTFAVPALREPQPQSLSNAAWAPAETRCLSGRPLLSFAGHLDAIFEP
eukprot:s4106_g4.t1